MWRKTPDSTGFWWARRPAEKGFLTIAYVTIEPDARLAVLLGTDDVLDLTTPGNFFWLKATPPKWSR